MARHTGYAHVALHQGPGPAWLFTRMTRLAREIAVYIVADQGAEQLLRRLSDPFWFQAFGCVLGFDWHSSGVTTTVTGALKQGLAGIDREVGLYAEGGKGATSRKTPGEIIERCDLLSVNPEPLVSIARPTTGRSTYCTARSRATVDRSEKVDALKRLGRFTKATEPRAGNG